MMSDYIGGVVGILLIAYWLSHIGFLKRRAVMQDPQPLPQPERRDKLQRILDAYQIDGITRAHGSSWVCWYDENGGRHDALSYPTTGGALEIEMEWNGETYEATWDV